MIQKSLLKNVISNKVITNIFLLKNNANLQVYVNTDFRQNSNLKNV